jgi:hypothetical protein
MKKFLPLAIACSATFAALNPATARAQETDGGQVALGLALMAASTGMGVLTGYSLWGGCRDCEKTAFNDQYFKEHYVSLTQDLALGAGESVLDLASAVDVPPENVGRFGKVLRTHRAELLALANPATITPADAERLLARIDQLAFTAGLKRVAPAQKERPIQLAQRGD